MEYQFFRLIIWRSLVQAQAGPQTKRLISNEIEPFLVHGDLRLRVCCLVIFSIVLGIC